MNKANEPEPGEMNIGLWVVTLGVLVVVSAILWLTELAGLLTGLFR